MGGSARHRWRRGLAVGLLAVVAVAALEAVPGVPGHAPAALSADLAVSDATSAAAGVDPFSHSGPASSCAGLVARFGVGNHLFKNSAVGFYASVWPSYLALSAMRLDSNRQPSCRPDLQQSLAAIDRDYWDRSVAGLPAAYDQGPRAFHIASNLPRVDDSLWMGLVLMQQYAAHRAPALLHRAEAVFAYATANWDRRGGGIYWEATGSGNPERSVVSNAPAAVLGLELFEQVHRPSYLAWSERIADWLTGALRDRRTGLYDDHVGEPGRPTRVDAATYTYTQGIMTGLLALLSQVDPGRYRFGAAVALARRAMGYFSAHHTYGQPAFDVIWAESVLWLADRYRSPGFTRQAQASVARARAAAPSGAGDLLTAASRLALSRLAGSPGPDGGDLLYASPP